MLSRIAESLFWIGRYAERAESTARLLQGHLRLIVEEPSQPQAATSGALLQIMGIGPEAWADPAGADHEDLVRLLGYDRGQPSSVVSCWEATRDNARRAREVIPQELWELINTTWQRLPDRAVPAMRAHGFLDWAKERGALFTGLARGSMMRDDGWQFLVLGRALEQADMTSRLVTSAVVSTAATPWLAVLRAAGAHDGFLRSYRGFRAGREAAGFLITDRRFPRSVLHALETAIDALAKLGAPDSDDARRALGRLRAHFEYADLDDLVGDLAGEMAQVQEVCERVTRLVGARYFAIGTDQAWSTEEAR